MPETRRNAVLIQQASGAHEEMLRLTEARHRDYCALHGIDYQPVYGEQPLLLEGRHPYWIKPALVKKALADGYDYVIWLDADTLIVGDQDLREACPEDGIGTTWHDLTAKGFSPPCYDHYNCGAIYVTNTERTRRFVEEWWHTPDDGHGWHDQHAFNKAAEARPGIVHAIDLKWNSTPPFYESRASVVKAWHGYGNLGQRLRAMREAMGLRDDTDVPESHGLGTDRHRWMLYGLVRWLRPQQVVEVGTWHGNTAIALASALKANGAGRLLCIDDFSLGGSDLETLAQNLAAAGVADYVDVAPCKSTEAEWPITVDLAFIDGDHSFLGCKADVDRAILHGASCIVLHDTTGWWGPRKLVEEDVPPGFTLISVDFDGGVTVLMRECQRSPVTFAEDQFPQGEVQFRPEDVGVSEYYEEARRCVREGLFERAEQCFRMALARDRDEPQILIDFADMYARTKRHEEAASVLQLCVSYQPDSGDAWRQLGGAYTYLGMHDEAGAAYERGLALAPDNAALRWNRALWLLAEGRWREGWEEFRWGAVNGVGRRVRTLKPEWDGQPIPGKTLFVWAEDGFGDTIMYARFLAMARDRSQAKIVLEVQAAVVALLHTLEGTDYVFKQTQDGSIPYAWEEHISLMSLPRVLGITPDNMPQDPYLSAAPELIPGSGLKIGMCRSGSPTHSNDFQRSVPANLMRRFQDLEGATILSLHKEAGNDLHDFTDTAQRVAGLDLVITVDTAVAHLAGAMGKQVWVLLPKACDYRWGVSGETSVWYPSARLFRQKERGNWEEVLGRVIAALQSEYGVKLREGNP